MNFRKLNLESALFILALVIGLGLRFYNLGAAPLNESESGWALQALQVARPDLVVPDRLPEDGLSFGPQPAYVFLSGAVFSLFGSSNFMARLWPALAGWSLVWLPLLLYHSLGRKAALVLTFGLAIDPGLVLTSRIAGGPAMAYGFGILALGMVLAEFPLAAGIFTGLALLSGPAVLHGGLGLLLTAAFSFLLPAALSRLQRQPANNPVKAKEEPPENNGYNLSLISTAAGICILVVGTLFFRFPQGLSAWFSTLPAYLSGWSQPSGIPFTRLISALLFYQPFVLLFALIGLFGWLLRSARNATQEPYRQGLTLIWALFSLAIVLIYPARQTTDLVWVIIPLWILAANELGEYLPGEYLSGEYLPGKHPQILSVLLAGLIFLFASLFWTTLVATSKASPVAGVSWLGVRLAILGGILALGALTSALVALGWNWETSRYGSAWGICLVLLVHSTAVLWGSTQLRPNDPQELWVTPPGTGQIGQFMDTLEQLSKWHSGAAGQIDIVSTVKSPSLRWALRDYKNVRYLDQLPNRDIPAVAITTLTAEAPALAAAYRGQDFVWWVQPGWSGATPPETVKWLAFREAPVVNEYIILWARADIFPGGKVEPDQPDMDGGLPQEESDGRQNE